MARASYLEDTCKTALNRVPDAARVPFRWTINPYRGCTHACHYCFARAFHALPRPGRRRGLLHEDRRSRRTSSRCCAASSPSPKWTGEPIAMGTATDPYQHCEGRYRLTRGVARGADRGVGNPLSMLTKSTMVVRDLDLYVRLAEVADVSVAMSVGTLDEDVRRVVEPGTPPGRKRLEILGRFAAAGIRTGVLVAPVLPGLTDDDAHLEEVLAACAAKAGIAWATVIPLHIRPGIRDALHPVARGALPAARRPLRAALRHPRLRAARLRRRSSAARFARAARQARPRRHRRTGPDGRCRAASAASWRSPCRHPSPARRSGHNRAMPLPLEDYGLVGRHADRGARRQRRLDRLALHARASTRRRASRRCSGRPTTAAGSSRRRARRGRRGATSTSTLSCTPTYETDDGAVRVLDFMPPRETGAGHRPDRRGRARPRRRCAWSSSSASTTDASSRGCGGWTARSFMVGGPDALALRTPVETRGEDLTTRGRVHVAEGDRIPFVLTWYPSHEPHAARGRRRRTRSRTRAAGGREWAAR